MNLQHLRYAVEIANFGSISRAAQALYVSQPYLSKIIRELEEQKWNYAHRQRASFS